MINIANRQIFICFFDFLKKNMGPSNMGKCIYILDQEEKRKLFRKMSVRPTVRKSYVH